MSRACSRFFCTVRATFTCPQGFHPWPEGLSLQTKGRGGHGAGFTTVPFPWKSRAAFPLRPLPKGQGSLGRCWRETCCAQTSVLAEGIKSPTRRASLNYKPKLCPPQYRSKYPVTEVCAKSAIKHLVRPAT